MVKQRSSTKERKPSELDPGELRARIGEGPEPERIDPSFWVEVSNYLQHHKVKNRSAAEQVEIVQRVRQLSLRLPDRSGGGDVRAIVYWLCSDGRFSDCDNAAHTILGMDSLEELERVFRDRILRGTEALKDQDSAPESRNSDTHWFIGGSE